MNQKPIVLMQPYVTDKMRAAAAAVLETNWIGQGPKVDEFERAFEDVLGVDRLKYSAVAVSSCTAALHLAYMLAGIEPISVVLCPVFTCAATNIALRYTGARLRMIDVEPDGLNMDPEHLRRALHEERKAQARHVVIVHYGGEPARAALKTAKDAGAIVIEDCAQSLGAAIDSDSQYRCYSFQAVKHLTTCDGGMLVCPKDEAAEVKRRRWFGIDRHAKLAGKWANDIKELGFKYQMTDVSAAMGLAGLEDLNDQLYQRRRMATAYLLRLEGTSGIRIIGGDEGSADWLMTVAVERRESLMRALAAAGIEAGIVHYRNDTNTIFADCRRRGDFPNMDAIEPYYLCLPLHMGMTLEDVDRICDVIEKGW
jgi:perosamine synthetase